MIKDTNHLKNFILFKIPKISTEFDNYLLKCTELSETQELLIPQIQVYKSKQQNCYYCFAAFSKSSPLNLLDFTEFFNIQNFTLEFFSQSQDFVIAQRQLFEKDQFCFLTNWGGALVFVPFPAYWLTKKE